MPFLITTKLNELGKEESSSTCPQHWSYPHYLLYKKFLRVQRTYYDFFPTQTASREHAVLLSTGKTERSLRILLQDKSSIHVLQFAYVR
jgi:hypothetical protein